MFEFRYASLEYPSLLSLPKRVSEESYKTTILEIKISEQPGGIIGFIVPPTPKSVTSFLNVKIRLKVSFSSLEIVTLIGIVSSVLSALATLIFSLIWFINGVPFAGYGTIVGLLSVGFSLVLLSIGILAQYLSLIYEEVKQRPLYVVSEKIGL
jgi:hypothetical protein